MTNCHDVEYEAAAANVQEVYLQNKNRSKKEIIEKISLLDNKLRKVR